MAEYSNGKALNTRMPDEMYEDIQQEKKQTGKSQGLIVRQALLKSGYGVRKGKRGKKKSK